MLAKTIIYLLARKKIVQSCYVGKTSVFRPQSSHSVGKSGKKIKIKNLIDLTGFYVAVFMYFVLYSHAR